MMEMFPGTSRHQFDRGKKHASMGLSGVPIEPGKYFCVKVTDEQINHFMDFIQFSGLFQDVASGTRTVKLSSNRKIPMPNVIRIVHKAGVIRLFEGACDKDGTTERMVDHQHKLYGISLITVLQVKEKAWLVLRMWRPKDQMLSIL